MHKASAWLSKRLEIGKPMKTHTALANPRLGPLREIAAQKQKGKTSKPSSGPNRDTKAPPPKRENTGFSLPTRPAPQGLSPDKERRTGTSEEKVGGGVGGGGEDKEKEGTKEKNTKSKH